MCLVLDQFLWGHSSRVCDISCLLIAYWDIFHGCMLIFVKIDFLFQTFFSCKPSRVSNSLDPDQARQLHFVGSDQGPNCWQRLTADDTSR